MAKASLYLSPVLKLVQAEAEAIGVSFPALLTADLVRFRRLAAASVPSLTDWQWNLLTHVLSGIEAHRILSGVDDLPTAGAIIAEIDTWADGALDDDTMRAAELRQQVAQWTPLTIAGVLIRLRGNPAPAMRQPLSAGGQR